jgi:hypothetical protein
LFPGQKQNLIYEKSYSDVEYLANVELQRMQGANPTSWKQNITLEIGDFPLKIVRDLLTSSFSTIPDVEEGFYRYVFTGVTSQGQVCVVNSVNIYIRSDDGLEGNSPNCKGSV